MRMPAGRFLAAGWRQHALDGIAERRPADQVGADHDAPHAVVAVDRGRALRRTRDGATADSGTDAPDAVGTVQRDSSS